MSNDLPVSVFAYGSNLHLRRIRERVPSARPMAMGYVTQRRLAFHKRGLDGSAKADSAFSANPNDRVWGMVYQIDLAEKPALDEYESLGAGYDHEEVNVVTAQGINLRAWIYVARPAAIDDSLTPFCWYREFVIQGACEHRLPFCYIANLHRIKATVDPDRNRLQLNRRRLSKT